MLNVILTVSAVSLAVSILSLYLSYKAILAIKTAFSASADIKNTSIYIDDSDTVHGSDTSIDSVDDTIKAVHIEWDDNSEYWAEIEAKRRTYTGL